MIIFNMQKLFLDPTYPFGGKRFDRSTRSLVHSLIVLLGYEGHQINYTEVPNCKLL